MTGKTVELQDVEGKIGRYELVSERRRFVGGCEGNKYSVILQISEVEVPFFVKEYCNKNQVLAYYSANSYFEAWRRFKEYNLPVPDQMMITTRENLSVFLYMSDMLIGRERIYGFSDQMTPVEMQLRRIPFNRQQRAEIEEKTHMIMSTASEHYFRIYYHNWHLAVGEGVIAPFICDIDKSNCRDRLPGPRELLTDSNEKEWKTFIRGLPK